MLILSVLFLVVFALGMAACVMHLRSKLDEARMDAHILEMELNLANVKLEHQAELQVVNERVIHHLDQNVRNLRLDLNGAHSNLEMVLKHEDAFKNISVEVGRDGVLYQFTNPVPTHALGD